MTSLPIFECDGCGACCRTWPVFVFEADADREPRIAAQGRREPDRSRKPPWTYHLNFEAGNLACCFLASDQRCSIYETRPKLCRDFTAGSIQCQEARQRHGLPPLNALVEASSP